MKQTILTTGINGLVGSKFKKDFADKYDFDSLDISDPTNPTDITDYDQVINRFKNSDTKFVIHLAAFTNVTAAFEQKDDKNGICWKVNVLGTENIIKACQETGKHLIHISTAYVFDGEKEGLYTEEDQPKPIEWYGQTKYEAEQRVINSDIAWTILRIDQPFRSDEFARKDVAHKIIDGLNEGNLNPQFSNQYFGPTFIDDFAKILDWVIRTSTTGLYHATSGEQWNPYDFATAIKEKLNLSGKVKKGDLDEYLKTLNRPYQKNTAMNCEKLQKLLDFEAKTILQSIKEIII
jgi:dTDP-4-dehydrorhamnose reductase